MDPTYGAGPLGVEDEDERRRKAIEGATEPSATGSQAAIGGASQTAGPTFSELQRRGYARPPQPSRPAGSFYRPYSSLPPQQVGGSPTQPPMLRPPGTGGWNFPRPEIGPQQTADFGTHLNQQYTNYKGPGVFGAAYNPHQAPTFTPGAKEINAPGSSPALPKNFAPGGFDGSYDAVKAPVLKTTGQFNAPGSQFGNDLRGALSQQLRNPSSFDSDAVQGMFTRLSGQIDDEYTTKDRFLQEDMAKRGLAESSIRGGRMADLNVEKRSAKTELADRLLERMAQTGSADTRAAISQALGYDESIFGRGLQGHQAQLGTNQQNFQQDLVSRAFQGDQQAMALTQNMGIQGFNNQAGQQGFQNAMQGAQMQNQFMNDRFGQQLQAGGFNQGLAQDSFNNAMAGANFNAGQAQQGYQNNLTNFQANLGAGQQGFNQQQALLSSLLGYKQQGFENEMQRSQFESDNDFRNRQLAAAMASLGL